jgi:hypothetical protein
VLLCLKIHKTFFNFAWKEYNTGMVNSRDWVHYPVFSEEEINAKEQEVQDNNKKHWANNSDFETKWEYLKTDRLNRPDEPPEEYINDLQEIFRVYDEVQHLACERDSMVEANFAVISGKSTINQAHLTRIQVIKEYSKKEKLDVESTNLKIKSIVSALFPIKK